MDDLRYPVGPFQMDGDSLTDDERRRLLAQIAEAPERLRAAVRGLDDEQLDTPYRPGGWTVRQVTHHVPDSHLNSYIRFKWALTEDEPAIKIYDEARWAMLADTRDTPLDVSLDLLDALHRRWLILLNSLAPADFARRFRHPELGLVSLDKAVALYAWHGRHHVAHVTSLREREGWR